jgi:hypothetical protein
MPGHVRLELAEPKSSPTNRGLWRRGDRVADGLGSGVDLRAITTGSFLEDIMRLSFRTIAVSALTLITSSTLATAAEVRVLSVGSTQIAATAV